MTMPFGRSFAGRALRRSLSLAAGAAGVFVVSLTLVAVTGGSSNAVQGPTEVMVVNDAMQAVPTTVRGTASVSVAGPVQIADTFEPFSAYVTAIQQPDQQYVTLPLVTVPADRRLVIDFVTGRTSRAGADGYPEGAPSSFTLSTRDVPDAWMSHSLAAPEGLLTQQMTMYFPPEATVDVTFQSVEGFRARQPVFGTLEITGHFVPVP